MCGPAKLWQSHVLVVQEVHKCPYRLKQPFYYLHDWHASPNNAKSEHMDMNYRITSSNFEEYCTSTMVFILANSNIDEKRRVPIRDNY